MIRPQLVTLTASTQDQRLVNFYQHLEVFGTLSPLERALVVVRQTVTRTGHDPIPVSLRQGAVIPSVEYIPPVPAFALAAEAALRLYPEAPVFACLHDDCLVETKGWDHQVLQYFQDHPRCGLLGFGGAWGLGDPAIANPEEPYRPTLLVRRGFMSNMHDAESHGTRVTEPRRVAVLDGFSLIVRREFLQGCNSPNSPWVMDDQGSLWQYLAGLRLRHHAYDAAFGILAETLGWEVHLLPLACRHLGGQTAVGDSGYARWAFTQHPEGDAGFHDEAHRIVWSRWKHYLPIVVDPPDGV